MKKNNILWGIIIGIIIAMQVQPANAHTYLDKGENYWFQIDSFGESGVTQGNAQRGE